MKLLLCVCVLFVATSWASLESQRAQKEDGFGPKRIERRKRSALFNILSGAGRLGTKAANKLLKGATPTRSDSPYIRTYEKPGNFDKALKDFDSVNPQAINFIGPKGLELQGKSGFVGDRVILLQNFGKPTLEIWNYKANTLLGNIQRITYMD